jgi:hypothetical protein
MKGREDGSSKKFAIFTLILLESGGTSKAAKNWPPPSAPNGPFFAFFAVFQPVGRYKPQKTKTSNASKTKH